MFSFFKKLPCEIILLAYDKSSFWEKVVYSRDILLTFGPIAFLLNGFDLWFNSNQKFCQSAIIVLIGNLLIGAWYHHRMRTFSYESFFKKNSMMVAVVIVTYILLEQLRLTAGDNYAGEAFKVVIQLATLLWPVSKSLKNIYILSNKQHPPSFIMNRLYNFEKTGNINQLFDTGNGAAEETFNEQNTEE